jgi:hypothetical protein
VLRSAIRPHLAEHPQSPVSYAAGLCLSFSTPLHPRHASPGAAVAQRVSSTHARGRSRGAHDPLARRTRVHRRNRAWSPTAERRRCALDIISEQRRRRGRVTRWLRVSVRSQRGRQAGSYGDQWRVERARGHPVWRDRSTPPPRGWRTTAFAALGPTWGLRSPLARMADSTCPRMARRCVTAKRRKGSTPTWPEAGNCSR